jgi:hypothetical protein
MSIELIVGSVLCLVHLAIGLAIGAKVGRSTVCITGAPFVPCDEPAETQRLLSLWFDLRLRLSELTLCARQVQQLPLDTVARWRNELSQLTSQLGNALEHSVPSGGVIDKKAQELLATPDRGSFDEAMPGGEVATNAQLLELVSGPVDCDNPERPLVRHRFSAKQPLAPAINNGPLPAEAFRMVQFHDLSIRDIRYFEDELPSEEKVVIGLGVPKPVKWIAAKVENSRSAFMYGRVGYLVTARYLASIDKPGAATTSQLVANSAGG